jgi:hypothetical protein
MKLYFFQFYSRSTFLFVIFVFYYFNKLEKKYKQFIFQLIFHNIIKYWKIFLKLSKNNSLYKNLFFKKINFQK